jgi:hypothetical protein
MLRRDNIFMRTFVRRRAALIGIGVLATAGAAIAPAVAFADSPSDAPSSLVEDYKYPGAAAIEAAGGPKLISGDGHIQLADCDGNPDLVKMETLLDDVCFAVQGDTGWLSLRVDAVFLVGAGDQDVAVSVEGMTAPILVPEGNSRPVQAVDPARRGLVVEIRATPPK